MQNELLRTLRQINEDNYSFLVEIKKTNVTRNNLERLFQGMDFINKNIPDSIVSKYSEFFHNFSFFCNKCFQSTFTKENLEMLNSSLELYIECVEEIKSEFSNKIKKCVCCNKEVVYNPLPKYYETMQYKYGSKEKVKSETLNKEEYLCPVCGASDRDRLIVSFLRENGLQRAAEGTKVLQFAPAKVISNWIEINCPQLEYHTTDLFMDHVTFKSDIQNMFMVDDNTYDLIICSHVLEHVQNDEKSMAEMKRILKSDGKLVFLVPINLNQDLIDEEWGLSEKENWRRFGQGDHCRRYGKKGLLERLSKYFYINQLGLEYLGEEIFEQCGLTDTSMLYVLTKSEEVSLSFEEEIVIDDKLCNEGPLVSVVLPCYNHGQFVAEAIESIIGQSYKNIEILVVDDGSSDNSVSIIKQYSSYFAKEIYCEENTGFRLNDLIKFAKGKYVAIMHSDDLWEKDKIVMQVQYLEKHPECGICFSWCKYVDDKLGEIHNNIFIKGNRNNYEWMRYFWQHGNTLCHPSVIMCTKIANEIPKYGIACRQLPDFFKWVYLIQKYSIYIIPKVLVKMRRYKKEGIENTSAQTKRNNIRHMMEEGNNWMWIIRDMSFDFFKNTFSEIMINPDIETEEELKCEKYFLLLKHDNIFIQSSAFMYISEIYNEVSECLKEKYNYTRRDIAEDRLEKSYARYFL